MLFPNKFVRRCRAIALMSTMWLAFSFASNLVAQDWPAFRGPSGTGHADGSPAVRWSEDENVAWKRPIVGKGWSSPVILGDQIWLTTAIAEQASEEEKEQRLESTTNSQPLDVVRHLTMRAICLDTETGEIRHDVELMQKDHPEPIHVLNSFASPTPVLEPGRLYCHFGPNGTCCIDTDSGEVVWRNQSDELVVKTENGAGSTPIVWNDLLIVHFDGSDVQFIAALDKRTGDVVWRTPRSGEMHDNPQLKKSYGTPLVVPIDDQPVLISPAANWLYAYDPSDGRELWKLSYDTLGFSIVPKPIEQDGVIFLCTSFTKSELLAIRVSDGGSSTDPQIEWRYKNQVSSTPSPILVDDLVYFVADEGGVLTCVDATSGEMVYRKRLGGNYSASPIFADGRIYFFDREGTTHVVKPGRTFEQIAENRLDGSFMASAAIVGNALFLRTDKAMYRIDEK